MQSGQRGLTFCQFYVDVVYDMPVTVAVECLVVYCSEMTEYPPRSSRTCVVPVAVCIIC